MTILRIAVVMAVLGVIGILRHPDTPYFIKGLWRLMKISLGSKVQKLAGSLREQISGLNSKRQPVSGKISGTFMPVWQASSPLRPFLSNSLRRALIVAVIILFLAATGTWSYNFYIFLRIFVTGTLTLVLLKIYPRREMFWSVVLGLIALTFNPVAPFHFSRSTWQHLNALAALSVGILAAISRARIDEVVNTEPPLRQDDEVHYLRRP